MQLSTNDAHRVLRKLEFELTECKHHVRGFFCLDGKRMFPVHFSFGNKDLPGNVPHRFRKSLRLTDAEFKELLSCHIDRTKYEDIIRRREPAMFRPHSIVMG
jgi:hypothetical protein